MTLLIEDILEALPKTFLFLVYVSLNLYHSHIEELLHIIKDRDSSVRIKACPKVLEFLFACLIFEHEFKGLIKSANLALELLNLLVRYLTIFYADCHVLGYFLVLIVKNGKPFGLELILLEG